MEARLNLNLDLVRFPWSGDESRPTVPFISILESRGDTNKINCLIAVKLSAVFLCEGRNQGFPSRVGEPRGTSAMFSFPDSKQTRGVAVWGALSFQSTHASRYRDHRYPCRGPGLI